MISSLRMRVHGKKYMLNDINSTVCFENNSQRDIHKDIFRPLRLGEKHRKYNWRMILNRYNNLMNIFYIIHWKGKGGKDSNQHIFHQEGPMDSYMKYNHLVQVHGIRSSQWNTINKHSSQYQSS